MHPSDSALSGLQKALDKYVGILCEARKKKGMTEQQARDSLQDINVYGTLMVLAGDADGMVSGATTTTANTIRPALQVSTSVTNCKSMSITYSHESSTRRALLAMLLCLMTLNGQPSCSCMLPPTASLACSYIMQ